MGRVDEGSTAVTGVGRVRRIVRLPVTLTFKSHCSFPVGRRLVPSAARCLCAQLVHTRQPGGRPARCTTGCLARPRRHQPRLILRHFLHWPPRTLSWGSQLRQAPSVAAMPVCSSVCSCGNSLISLVVLSAGQGPFKVRVKDLCHQYCWTAAWFLSLATSRF
jgi:hypothetical protein